MTITKFSAEVLENLLLAPGVHHIVLGLQNPSEIDFTAGQYATFILNPSIRRSYSFCSSPKLKNRLELCADNYAGGPGSAWLDSLKTKDHVEFLAPLGKFMVDHNSSKEKVFVATGTGIAPIRSMIFDLLEREPVQKVILLFGIRSQENGLFFADFEKLAQKNKNFLYQPIISQPSEGWLGEKGRVNYLLEKMDKDYCLNSKFYLCGNHHMINGVKEQLKRIGVLPEDIHFEQFY